MENLSKKTKYLFALKKMRINSYVYIYSIKSFLKDKKIDDKESREQKEEKSLYFIHYY